MTKLMWYNVSIPDPFGGNPTTFESATKKLSEERQKLVDVIEKARDRPIDLWFVQTESGRNAAAMLDYIDRQILAVKSSFVEYAHWKNERNTHYEPKAYN